MKKRKNRVFPVWSFQEEEDWLNEMAEQGWLLEAVTFCGYDFVSVEPGSYQIRLQLLKEQRDAEDSLD